ncbi:MAG: CIA30 family protein [Ignavibacteria bacterium]|jgi:monofunctional biosynthetic peptidoglycan transglycosylase
MDKIIFDFSPGKTAEWTVVNDFVMGGVSSSSFKVNSDTTALFSGNVSLENNGGFASAKSFCKEYVFSGFEGVIIKVKGDGNLYSFRVRTDANIDGINYRIDFLTKHNEWLEIKLPFSEFVPTFRGKRLANVKPFEPSQIQQVGFLIGNKQEGVFNLYIDWIKAFK